MSQAKPLSLATDERELRQRDFLLRAAQAISEPLDLREVLARVIRTAVSMTGGHAGAIALRQSEGDLQVVASYRLDASFEIHLESLLDPYGMQVTGSEETSTTGTPDREAEASSRAPQVGRDPRTMEEPSRRADFGAYEDSAPSAAPLARYDRALAEGITVHDIEAGAGEAEDPQQMLNLPLDLAGKTIGRIFVFRSQGAAAFTPLDAELLELFADQAAVAIHNADTHMRLAARERRLAKLVEHGPAGVLLLDAEGRVRSYNPAAARLLGRDAESLAGQPAGDLIRLIDAQDRPLDFALPEGEAPAGALGHLRLSGGRRGAWAQVTATPLPDPRRSRAGWVVDLIDLSGYKEAEDARRAFLAGLSHELKTPLSLIRGYAETLRYPQVRQDDALHEEAIGVVLEETDHLTRLVDQLLTAARLEADALELDLHTVEPRAELERLVEGFRRARPAHRWALELAEDLPVLRADPTRLREIFGNLLSNAAKYSPEGSTIMLRAEPDGAGLRVEVRDEGIGIDEAERERIFERFYRVSESGNGAGLGLYMARAIAEAHGGRIDLASQPGQGSSFSVWLPAETRTASGGGTAGRATDAATGPPEARQSKGDDREAASDPSGSRPEQQGANRG